MVGFYVIYVFKKNNKVLKVIIVGEVEIIVVMGVIILDILMVDGVDVLKFKIGMKVCVDVDSGEVEIFEDGE